MEFYSAMKTWVVRNKLEAAGGLTGALAGWCYWYFVGCASGQCPITSSPVISTIYGAFMGWLLFSMFKKSGKSKQQKQS